MNPLSSREWLGLAFLAVAQAASAGTVSVNVRTTAGMPAEDTVVVLDPLDAAPPPPAHERAVIDQLHKTFVPRVSVIRTGTVVALPNSDSIRHEVYSHSPPHPFQVKLYARSHTEEVTFDKPGLLVLGCNIHDSMVAFVAVVDSPYYAKILGSGQADMHVPPGRYRVRVWHPELRIAVESQLITVTSAPLTLPVKVDLDPDRETAADWPE
ncbi:MAG: methylamine utilization protein [Steroidobacteraceae bacterium]|jgi:plastocyanin